MNERAFDNIIFGLTDCLLLLGAAVVYGLTHAPLGVFQHPWGFSRIAKKRGRVAPPAFRPPLVN